MGPCTASPRFVRDERRRTEHANETQPIGFSRIYFPASIGKKLSKRDFADASSSGPLSAFPVVEARTGRKMDHAKVAVGADPASAAAGTRLIRALDSSPLVRVQCLFVCADAPIMLSMNWFDARLYAVSYQLSV